MLSLLHFIFFFFNDTATTEIYTLSLHDALPISSVKFRPAKSSIGPVSFVIRVGRMALGGVGTGAGGALRSEEHTSELQSRLHLVCRLLLEKKKKTRCVYMHRVFDNNPQPVLLYT